MRVVSEQGSIAPDDRGLAHVELDVQNTAEVIDALVVRLVGLPIYAGPEPGLSAQPAILPLFPDASGRISVTIEVPPTFPAGQHAIALEVASHSNLQPPQQAPLVLSVPPRPALEASVRPQRVRSRRQAEFMLDVLNVGNIGLDSAVRAADADRALTIATGADRLYLEAGGQARIRILARGPRMWFGTELDRSMTVEVTGRAITDASELQASASASPVLRQRPIITRGLLTALILPALVALWALAFLLGANRVFNSDPVTKAVPASFYAGAVSPDGAAAAASAAAPAGALPKNGQLPPGVGGTIGGTVTAASDGSPVGRMEVNAFRKDATGALVLVSSGATQADGTYSIAGLFPGPYFIRVSADGYDTAWFPGVADPAGAVPVTASAAQPTSDVNVVIIGHPASITGTVSLGSTLTTVPVSVAARTLSNTGAASSQTPVATTTTASDGSYTLTNLPAPATYELAFSAAGYQPATLVVALSGGQARIEPAVQMSAGSGQISGLVTDGSAPLGGVTISTTVNNQTVTTGTPTTGAVGTYVLPNLPTPGTYLITYSLTGYGTRTIVVDLAAGQSQSGVNVAIAGGTGTVNGRVIDGAGNGIGGATVTVGGGPSAATTTTLTSGSVGTFVLSGLPAPGSYTLTVALPGYSSQTVPVSLSGSGPPPAVTISMPVASGSLLGKASFCDAAGACTAPAVGATVTATDGRTIQTTTVTSSGTSKGAGGYLLTGLAPGTYSVTVSAPGYAQVTALATVTAGVQADVADIALPKAG